ncbi:hypothetical protein [Tellurirhabdus bombi]|uniref:hypothetical protein n=1 Tax=Tellurirhabdus bombi TaxID=2907205 RepID=UPI001F281DC3|nr:hypothetical protein [Tellurirhabdus bombi]
MKEASTTEMQKLLNEIIGLLDIKVSDRERDAHDKRIYEFALYLQNAYPTVRLSDVRLAYHLGCKYELGIEMFAEINARSFGKVMKAYWEFRKATITTRKVPQLEEPKEPLPSEEELDKKGRELLRLAYQTFKQGRQYRDHGNLLYNSLFSIKKIPFNYERKMEMLQQAQKEIEQENSKLAQSGNTDRHKEAQRIANLLNEPTALNEQPGEIQSLIKSRAKQIAFATLMRELIEMGIETDEFLDQE